MPIMDVRFPAGSLDGKAKAALAEKLTDVLIRMEGGANTHGGRAFAWVLFTEVPVGDWWVGGRVDDALVSPPGRFLVHVSIPEGYMNRSHKTEVHSWVTEAIVEVAGGNSGQRPDAGSVMVIIDEVTEGNWGGGGHPISLSSIASSVGMPNEGERMLWSRKYFEAKARLEKLAGFPDDVGGVADFGAREKPAAPSR